jgi:L-alanine-DL-glutamate epimerase-like enolase superfamily enzyme
VSARSHSGTRPVSAIGVDGPIVQRVDVSAYTIPTDVPEADGTLSWDSTTLVLVRITTGDQTGTGWTYAPAAATKVVREQLAPVVIGHSALAPSVTWESMVRALRNAGRPGLGAMALSAVDIALWDLAARLLDAPLTTLWGHEVGTPVPVYGSGGFTSYSDDRTRDQLADWLQLGLPRVKIKIGEDRGTNVTRDLERAALTRQVVGDAVEVFVDANGAYTPARACRVGKQLDALGVTWFEEPVTSDDPPGLQIVRDHVAADIAAGEYGWDLGYYTGLIPVLDCVQVDVTRCGGYTEWFRVVALAAAHHLEVSGHCAPYVTVPAAGAAINFRHQEWFHDHVRIEQAFFEPTPDPVAGSLIPPRAPGHGLTFRKTDATRYRVA